MIERITHNNELIAIIIRHNFSEPGITFFTPDEFSQQIAYMKHSSGKVISPHVHNPVHRSVIFTQEVLFLKKGRMRVDFYDNEHQCLESSILQTGDTILLATGGHGFEALEEIEMIEVKQGPYTGDTDKTRFDGISCSEVVLKGNNHE